MSVGLLSRPPRSIRPAPAGSRPIAPWDARPDGWELIEPSPGERFLTRVDRILLSTADSVADRISRRTFLSRTGQLGLLIGLVGTRLLWGAEEGQAAPFCNTCVDPGETDRNDGACGPSEPCNVLNECSGANNGNCNLGWGCNNSNVQGQVWASGVCQPQNAGGTWDECCGSQITTCRDCCGCKIHSSGTCTQGTCSNKTRYKCICENHTSINCDQTFNLNC
jgi:hypothetical protein